MNKEEQENIENNVAEISDTNTAEENASVYEIGYLLVSKIPNEEILAEVSNIKSILEGQECVFLSGDEPKIKQLAYPISKMIAGEKRVFETAYFAWIKFEADKTKLAELKKRLDQVDNILRYFLIKALKKDNLVSNSKRFAFMKDGKSQTIKPAKIVKAKKEPISSEAKTETEIKKTPADNAEQEKQLDDTIDKLVI